MTITAEACKPENVERLIAALEKAEFQLRQAKAAITKTQAEVRAAINPVTQAEEARGGYVPPWSEMLAYITEAAARMRSPQVNEVEYRRLRGYLDSTNTHVEKQYRQVVAYSGVVCALRDMAQASDPKIIRFSGEDLLLVIRQLDGNPDL